MQKDPNGLTELTNDVPGIANMDKVVAKLKKKKNYNAYFIYIFFYINLSNNANCIH